MPAPKAVLRDIHDLNLQPKSSHNLVAKSGRLSSAKVLISETTKVEIKNEEIKIYQQVEAEPVSLVPEKEEKSVEEQVVITQQEVISEQSQDTSNLQQEEETINNTFKNKSKKKSSKA